MSTTEKCYELEDAKETIIKCNVLLCIGSCNKGH